MEPVRDPEQAEPDHLRRIKALPDARVIEIGCGDGRMTWRYAGIADSVIGVEPDGGLLAQALRTRPSHPGLIFNAVQASAEALPFRIRTFDTAIFAWAL